jgi:hypothetical protein
VTTKKIAALMVVTLVTLCPAMAYAGAGGSGQSVSVPLLVCYSLENAVNTGYELEIRDPQFGTHENVRLGKATMACKFLDANSATVEHGPSLTVPAPTSVRTLKCYDVPAGSPPVADTVNVTDIFGADTTEVMHLAVVCAPATEDVLP